MAGTKASVAALLLLPCAVLPGCGGKDGAGPLGPPDGQAACGSGPVLTTLPVAIADIWTVAPLGTLNPPGHVFPSDHPGYYLKAPGGVPAVTPVRSPADVVIVRVGRQVSAGRTDYTIDFFPCANLHLWLGHIIALAPELQAAVGSLEGNCVNLQGPSPIVECSKDVALDRAEGSLFGNAGGPGEPGLDFGGVDDRVPPLAYINTDRLYGRYGRSGALHAICPFDYFEAGLRSSMDSLWGEPGSRRTALPLCGRAMQDVPGTAQGRWFFPVAGDVQTDGPHLALVHRNTDPARGAFSVGTSIPSLPVGVYYFPVEDTGRVNLDFDRVMPDAAIRCYVPNQPAGRVILIQLPSATELRIESRPGSACGDPASWTLSGGAVTFSR